MPLLCCANVESGFFGSVGGTKDCAQPYAKTPLLLEVLKLAWLGSSNNKQFWHLYTKTQFVALTLE
jgi:hypothetical protein